MAKSFVHRTTRGAAGRPSRAAVKFMIGAAALATLAACSSSSSSSSGSSAATSSDSSSASSSGGDAYVTQSQQLLDRAHAAAVTGPSFGTVPVSDVVPWQSSDMPAPTAPPSKPLKVAVAYGIPSGYVPYAAHLIKAIGTKLGWTVTIFPASATTQAAELAAMQQALLGKPNVIISVVIPAVWVGPALTAAKAAGIYTVDIHQDSTDGTGYSAVVPSAEGVQKAMLAAWAVTHTNGKSEHDAGRRARILRRQHRCGAELPAGVRRLHHDDPAVQPDLVHGPDPDPEQRQVGAVRAHQRQLRDLAHRGPAADARARRDRRVSRLRGPAAG